MKKSCIKCHETKKLTDFYANPRYRDNRSNVCKECAKAYAIRQRAAEKEAEKRELESWVR